MRNISICLWALVCALFFVLSEVKAGPLSELILFSAKPDRYYQIYKVRPDGRELERLIAIKGDCREPSLCAATNEIAFSVFETNVWHLYKTDADGGSLQRISATQAHDRHPSWSPDGTKIVFETNRWGQSELAIMDSDGRNVRRLTHNQLVNRFPVWSPNGKKIAFISWMQGSSDIYTLNSDGKGNPKRLTRNYYPDCTPSWSFDSTKLIIDSQNHVSQYLAVIDSPFNMKRYISTTANSSYPAWSPDGKQVIFSYNDAKAKVHTLRLLDLESATVSDFPAVPPSQAFDVVWQRKQISW